MCVTLRSQPFAWVPRGVYIGLPPGGTIVIRLGAGPSRQCLRSPASLPAVGARRLVGPVGCRPLGRQAGPTPRVLSVAAYCSLASDDEGSVEVSVATVGRLGGSHCSLTSSCLLNAAHASREGVAGFWGPATPLADWGRPGRLRASLWLKGPAARGPYWRLSWMTLRPAWLQCRAGREMADPYGVLWPCLPRDSGVVGRTVATPRLVTVMWA